jgi:hypothetical protein
MSKKKYLKFGQFNHRRIYILSFKRQGVYIKWAIIVAIVVGIVLVLVVILFFASITTSIKRFGVLTI